MRVSGLNRFWYYAIMRHFHIFIETNKTVIVLGGADDRFAYLRIPSLTLRSLQIYPCLAKRGDVGVESPAAGVKNEKPLSKKELPLVLPKESALI